MASDRRELARPGHTWRTLARARDSRGAGRRRRSRCHRPGSQRNVGAVGSGSAEPRLRTGLLSLRATGLDASALLQALRLPPVIALAGSRPIPSLLPARLGGGSGSRRARALVVQVLEEAGLQIVAVNRAMGTQQRANLRPPDEAAIAQLDALELPVSSPPTDGVGRESHVRRRKQLSRLRK
jgi:hypothetical protein